MKIAVIGAGLSGLTAAQGLMQLGHEVTVYEKARGSGGRMASSRQQWGQLDMGAQYFTAKDPRFKRTVDEWQYRGWCDVWPFTPFQQQNQKLHASPDTVIRYAGVGGMSAITRGLAQSLPVNFQCQIKAVVRQADSWHLMSEHGDLGRFDWLVCSQPAEQIRQLIEGQSFLTDYLPKDLHRPCWALALATQGITNTGIDGIFAEDQLSWVSRLSSKPGISTPSDVDDLWLMHFDHHWSCQAGPEMNREELIAVAQAWLQKHFGSHIQVIHSHSHYWRYAQQAGVSQTTPALIDRPNNLACIGSWAAGGRVEGAFLSSQYFIRELANITS